PVLSLQRLGLRVRWSTAESSPALALVRSRTWQGDGDRLPWHRLWRHTGAAAGQHPYDTLRLAHRAVHPWCADDRTDTALRPFPAAPAGTDGASSFRPVIGADTSRSKVVSAHGVATCHLHALDIPAVAGRQHVLDWCGRRNDAEFETVAEPRPRLR